VSEIDFVVTFVQTVVAMFEGFQEVVEISVAPLLSSIRKDCQMRRRQRIPDELGSNAPFQL
jgi:hypothetical protein